MSKHLNGNMKSKHHGHNKNGKDLKNKQIKKGIIYIYIYIIYIYIYIYIYV